MSENEQKKAEPAQSTNPFLLPVMLTVIIYAAVCYYKHEVSSARNMPPAAQPEMVSAAEPQPDYEPEPAPAPARTADREIYLTFDDGPCQNTPDVLDILDRYDATATFFTVGTSVERYPNYAADIVKRGNLIACHSYTHEFDKCYASADAFIAETERWKRSVKNACGALPERICVRFPGGSTTNYAAAVREDIIDRLDDAGYCWFDWNAADNDKWPKGNTKKLSDEEYFLESYRECMSWYKNSPDVPVVFLMHDTEEGSVRILPMILQDLIDRGYAFKRLDEHPDWD